MERITYRSTGCTATAEYAVEVGKGRQGHRTIGRVCRMGNQWMALGVNARAWTGLEPTRSRAVTAMRAGRTFITDQALAA